MSFRSKVHGFLFMSCNAQRTGWIRLKLRELWRNSVETVVPGPDDLLLLLRPLEYSISCAQNRPSEPYTCAGLTAKPKKMRKIFAPTCLRVLRCCASITAGIAETTRQRLEATSRGCAEGRQGHKAVFEEEEHHRMRMGMNRPEEDAGARGRGRDALRGRL